MKKKLNGIEIMPKYWTNVTAALVFGQNVISWVLPSSAPAPAKAELAGLS